MKKKYWILIAVVVILSLLFFLGRGYLLRGWDHGDWMLMGPGMMHTGGFGFMGWAGMLLMWLVPISLITLFFVAIFGGIRAFTRGEPVQPGEDTPPVSSQSAQEILQIRYARGEIDREAYLQMLEDLS